jgi:hypothetical protein
MYPDVATRPSQESSASREWIGECPGVSTRRWACTLHLLGSGLLQDPFCFAWCRNVSSFSARPPRRGTAGVLVEERHCPDRGDLHTSASLSVLNRETCQFPTLLSGTAMCPVSLHNHHVQVQQEFLVEERLCPDRGVLHTSVSLFALNRETRQLQELKARLSMKH